jgi:hypothetical protein
LENPCEKVVFMDFAAFPCFDHKSGLVMVCAGAVGRICLLWAYSKQEIPPNYMSIVFNHDVVKPQVNNEEMMLQV